MASVLNKFRAFCCEAALDDTDAEVMALPSGLVSDDDEEPEERSVPIRSNAWRRGTDTPDPPTQEPTIDLNGPSNPPSTGEKEKAKAPTSEQPKTTGQPNVTDMGLPKTTNTNVILDEEDRQPTNDLAQLLAIHHQFGHISMRKLQEMAKKA